MIFNSTLTNADNLTLFPSPTSGEGVWKDSPDESGLTRQIAYRRYGKVKDLKLKSFVILDKNPCHPRGSLRPKDLRIFTIFPALDSSLITQNDKAGI